MFTLWTNHIAEKEDRERFARTVQSARPALERLSQVLEMEDARLNRQDLDPKSFDNPNWENRQAFNNGFRAALNRIKIFIDLDNQKVDTGENKL